MNIINQLLIYILYLIINIIIVINNKKIRLESLGKSHAEFTRVNHCPSFIIHHSSLNYIIYP